MFVYVYKMHKYWGSPDVKGIGIFFFFPLRTSDHSKEKNQSGSQDEQEWRVCAKTLGENWGISPQSPSLVQVHSNRILGTLEVL